MANLLVSVVNLEAVFLALYHAQASFVTVFFAPDHPQASFVTTWMEPQAEELIKESVNVNYVDTEEASCC